MEDLIAHAATMGLGIKWRDLGRRSGELHTAGIIVLNPRKSALTQRVTLAHELGHAWHGHDWTRAHDRERDERQADLYAARLLISRAEYAAAEQIVGCHPGALAKELGVTRRLIEIWQDTNEHRRTA